MEWDVLDSYPSFMDTMTTAGGYDGGNFVAYTPLEILN